MTARVSNKVHLRATTGSSLVARIIIMGKKKKSEVIIRLEKDLERMEELIRDQKFRIVDAQKFMERGINILRKMEQLTISRDLWKKKYEDLREAKG